MKIFVLIFFSVSNDEYEEKIVKSQLEMEIDESCDQKEDVDKNRFL